MVVVVAVAVAVAVGVGVGSSPGGGGHRSLPYSISSSNNDTPRSKSWPALAPSAVRRSWRKDQRRPGPCEFFVFMRIIQDHHD